MERAGDLVEAFLRMHNITGGQKYVQFFRSWHRIVGTDLAAHTQVTDIDRGALKVQVDHPGWMQMLQMKREEILSRIAREYPQLEIRTMQMRLVDSFGEDTPKDPGPPRGRGRKAGAPGAPSKSGAEDTEKGKAEDTAGGAAEESENAQEALEHIENEHLKETLSRLYEDLTDENTTESAD
ncbi:MAG: DUF721 domain-containing protein [Spirochaetaceae bacterium]